MRILLLLISFAVVSSAVDLSTLKPFLKQHCFDCHGADKQKGEIRLDTLGSDLSDHSNLEIWQNVLDQLNLGEMPPQKRPQPARSAVEPIVQTLTTSLATAYEQANSTGGETVLRRLNRHELRNTLRDLLYLNGAAWRPGTPVGSRLIDNNGNGSVERTGSNPLRFFPEDEAEDGFFNLGDKLVMSDFLLKLTLEAMEETLEQATVLEPRPTVETRRFAGHLIDDKKAGNRPIEGVARQFYPDYDLLAQGYERFGRLAPTKLRGGVGTAARYRVTIEVSAHNPDNPWPELVDMDETDPFQLCLNIADTKNGGIAGPSSTPLALWVVPPDGKLHTFTYETWIDPTWTPWIAWENGPIKREFRPEKVVEKYMPDAYFKRPDKKVDKEGHDNWIVNLCKLLHEDGYPAPHLRVHSLMVEPLIEVWPPRSHTALFGTASGEEAEVRTLLTRFAERAFRRPVEAAAIEPYVQLVMRDLTQPDVSKLGPLQNLRYRAFEGKWSKLPAFDELKPFFAGELASGLADIGIAKRNDYFGVVFDGELEAPTAGEYLFEMASDDGGRILVNGKKVLEHDGLHGAAHRKAPVELAAGTHKVRIEYFAYGAPNSFRAGWRGPGFEFAPFTVQSLHQKSGGKPKPVMPPVYRAMQNGYAALLCSPQFLYLEKKPGRLDSFDLATRLSYFLWSSMPDETLFERARSGTLDDPAELRRQVDRMIDDPKSAAFIRNFTAAWLRLDKLGDMPPSGGDFQFYKNLRVEPILERQVTLYFEEMLRDNQPIGKFIDSDTTYMNQTLAKWIYRRDGDVRGQRLRKVALDDPRRGGIFTLPGLMTATANGVETSPVIRGTWVLENILGTPPAPPPPDVEPLPTDTREATTVRQQLELHRKHEACSSCHNKIDPMGFAFENFDVVGRWREKYKRAKEPIDTTATLSNGREIEDIVAFKEMLKERQPLIVRCLASKMLTYATGRHLEATDRGELDRIVEQLGQKEDRLRDLVHLVVLSEIFRSK